MKDDITVLFRTSLHNTVYDVCSSRPGWGETDSDTDWDLNWADVGWIRDFYDHVHFDDLQRVNHFRNHYELTRKDLLIKNLKRMKRQLDRTDSNEGQAYNFFPSTFALPSEYGLFLEEFKRTAGSTWIMKPIGRAQGKGIFLFNKLSQISEWRKDHKWKADGPQAEAYIAQRYVDKPYTVGGKKFDLRLYVLVQSFSPLVVWTHRSGFARFSLQRYDQSGDLSDTYMHLTNYSIQKTAGNYSKEEGSKWSIHGLKMFMISRHGVEAVERLFQDILDLIIRSLLAVQKVVIQDKHSFELYGYDVLFDSNLKPWLIEVNASPSLTGSDPSDYDMKYKLVSDTLDVIDVEGNRTGEETQIEGYDLVWNNGPVEDENCYVGCKRQSSKKLVHKFSSK